MKMSLVLWRDYDTVLAYTKNNFDETISLENLVKTPDDSRIVFGTKVDLKISIKK